MTTYIIEKNSGRAAPGALDFDKIEADSVQVDNGCLIFRAGESTRSAFVPTLGETVAAYATGTWNNFRVEL